MQIQDPDGHSECVTRPRNIPAAGGHAQTREEAPGEEEALRDCFPKILGGLRGQGVRGCAPRRDRIVAARLILSAFERNTTDTIIPIPS